MKLSTKGTKKFVHVKGTSRHHRIKSSCHSNPDFLGLIPLNNKSEVIRLSDRYVKRIPIASC